MIENQTISAVKIYIIFEIEYKTKQNIIKGLPISVGLKSPPSTYGVIDDYKTQNHAICDVHYIYCNNPI